MDWMTFHTILHGEIIRESTHQHIEILSHNAHTSNKKNLLSDTDVFFVKCSLS